MMINCDPFDNDLMLHQLITEFSAGPSGIYRQVYLYGDQAKTAYTAAKLLCAYSEAHPDASIISQTCHFFAIGVVSALMRGTFTEYVKAFNDYDLIILRNVARIAGSKALMDQLYLILDRRLERHFPFLIIERTAPAAIPGLPPQVRAIFEGMLLWKL